MQKKMQIFLSAVMVAALVLLNPQSVLAGNGHGNPHFVNTSSPNVLIDEFHTAIKKPDLSKPWDYWYKVLISADEQGFLRKENLQHNVNCNNAVCVKKGNEGRTKFARLSLYPQQYPGTINMAGINEQRDAFSYGKPHRWLATHNHPIEMKVRFRASENYKPDGSGGAHGYFGIWMWNAADYWTDPDATDVERVNRWATHRDDTFMAGFFWFEQGNFQAIPGYAKGLLATVAPKTQLAASLHPIQNVNMNDWMDGKMRWEVDANGVHKFSYYMNGQFVGERVSPLPFPALTVQIQTLNERFQLGPNGTQVLEYLNPVAPQHLDIDRLEIRQL